MSRYIEILADSPIQIGVDDNFRTMYSINLTANAVSPVDKFEEELVKVLIDAGLATFGTDTGIGSDWVLPNGSGPYVQISDTGGLPTKEIHNGSIYEQRAAQVIVRAQGYETARTRALAVGRALHGQRNVTINS